MSLENRLLDYLEQANVYLKSIEDGISAFRKAGEEIKKDIIKNNIPVDEFVLVGTEKPVEEVKQEVDQYNYEEINAKELSNITNLSLSAIYCRARAGKIPYRKCGYRLLFNKQKVLDYMEKNKDEIVVPIEKRDYTEDEIYEINGIKYLDIKRAAELIDINLSTLYARTRRKEAPFKRIGKSTFINKDYVDKKVKYRRR